MSLQLAEVIGQLRAELSDATTQKIKLQLDPRRVGHPGKPLISGAAEPGER